ncbi:hypothetical protein [Brochothrix thermosphacta]|uniref:hypothetical protein n=1 Tax=Brochothrix thermosphacta TaxID=2756 RepID=UPI0039B045F2
MRKTSRYIFMLLIMITTLFANYSVTIASQIKVLPEDVKKVEKNTEQQQKLLPKAGNTGSIINYPDINIINNSTGASSKPVAGEYANILRASSLTTTKVVGAKSDTATTAVFDTAETSGGQHYLEYTNVGFYKGAIVNIRVNLESNVGGGALTVYKGTKVGSVDFLRLAVQGKGSKVGVRYDFINSVTGQKIEGYKGSWIVKRLNNYKTMEIDSSSDFLTRIFAYDIAKIDYSSDNNFQTTGFIGTIAATNIEKKETQMMYSFNTKNGSTTQKYSPEGGGNRNIYYDQDPITQMEIPFPSIIGIVNEKYPKVSYKIIQDYPSQINASFYPNKYTMKVDLDKIVDLSKMTYKVTDLSGADKTSYFKMIKRADKTGVDFTIDSSTLSSESFVNNSYTITLESEIDKSISTNDYLESDGYLHIPGTVAMQTDINNSTEHTDVAKTKYEAPPEDNKAPEVNITAPVKDGETYKYDPEKDSGKLSLAGQYRDVDSENVTAFLQVDDGSKLLIENPKPGSNAWYDATQDYTAEAIQKILADNKEHTFTLSANDTEGLETKKSIKVIWEKDTNNRAPEVNITAPVKDDETYKYDSEKDSGKLSLAGQYRDVDSENVTAFLQVDDGSKVLIENPKPGSNAWYDATQDYTAEAIQKILADNKEHTFTLSAGDNEGLETKKSIKMIWEKAPNKVPEIKIGIPVETGGTYEYFPEKHEDLGGILEIVANARDLDSKNFTTYLQVDDGEVEKLGIKPGGSDIYRDITKEYEEEEIQQILADNQPHTFTFYVEDSDGGKSEKVSITIIWPNKGELAMKSVPDVSFGNQDVNVTDKTFYVESKDEDLIIEDTRKDATSWKVNAQIDQELTNQATNKEVPSVLRYDDDYLSQDKITVFEKNKAEKGTFNLSEHWIDNKEGLNLFVKVGKISSGDYNARIMWSLEETPANN